MKTLDPIEYSLAGLTRYFVKLGTIGFGGPIALVGYMHRDLVEGSGWLSEEEYSRGLALAQLAPGPLAAQLAIYVGYIRAGILGASLVGVAFVLPSFLMVLVLGVLYQNFGGLPWMQALFYGIGASVIAIIARSTYKLTKTTCKDKTLLWIIAVLIFAVTVYTGHEIIWFLILGGIATLFSYAPPRFGERLGNVAAFMLLPAQEYKNLSDIFVFFLKAGVFVFGSGLAIVPFLHSGVVEQFHWLNEKQFLDAVAVAMITPGPVVITVSFIGYLVAGILGAIVAAFAIFFPIWLIVVLATPYYERFARNPQLKAFVQGITAATCGAIAGAVIILGRTTVKG